jgi:hypothetical protein
MLTRVDMKRLSCFESVCACVHVFACVCAHVRVGTHVVVLMQNMEDMTCRIYDKHNKYNTDIGLDFT